MLVSDLVNQYHNTLNSGSKIATKTKGVEQLSKVVKSLEKGQVFEGTVKDVKGDKVTLSLSSGQNITARLDKNISLEKGQSVFFQVKSNEGGTVQIKPVSSEFGGNPTLLNALKGAGLKETEANLKLINSMMKEQMPIDKASVMDMVKSMRANPDADIDTLVSLKKLDLPINESMITQFENYKESEGAILKMVDSLSEDIPKALSFESVSKEDVIAFQNDLLNIISGEEDEGFTPFRMVSDTESPVAFGADTGTIVSEDGKVINATVTEVASEVSTAAESTSKSQETIVNTLINEAAKDTPEIITTKEQSINAQDTNIARDTIGSLLSPEDNTKLSQALREIPGFREVASQIFTEDGRVKPNIEVPDLLKAVNTYFSQNPNVSKQKIINFLDTDPVKKMVGNLMGRAWTIEPKELLKKNAINELYEKIEEDMERVIESAKQRTHSENNPISNTAQSVKDNLSFIREVNQLYQYVQIPLQMSGEQTTGELYVYANKKQRRAENDEITAFLHFDMENLGSTDIAVKLAGKKIDTKFFLEDDISYNLIEQNLYILEQRLEELGYSCKLSCENDSRQINFVEDFLKQDSKSAGDIHRYSFDVRA